MSKDLSHPAFDKATKVHDWRNYVIDEYKEKWHQLSYQTRLAIYDHCDNMAAREEWD